jgi:hypothetical protein
MSRHVAAAMAALWCGVMIGQALVLFSVGPGTILPLVLTIGGAMAGGAILIGGTAGLGVRLLLQFLPANQPRR